MIYTTGYTGLKIEKLIAKVEELDAFIIDIRIKPWSRNKTWGQSNFIRTFKEKYIAGGEFFGNLNYRAPIEQAELKNYAGGLKMIEKLLNGEDKNIIFICMCKDREDCHRKIIAANLEKAGIGVRELDYTIYPPLAQEKT
jgi:uncharacterized protein (DUF488 family)